MQRKYWTRFLGLVEKRQYDNFLFFPEIKIFQRLEANGNELAHFERDIFNLRQHLQASVERNRGRGAASRETLEVEGHLRTIQARAMELERKRGDIIKNINHLKGNILLSNAN